ncbi:Fe2OG dioxygenase domain-containing protein, partial [Haematococcus lacustris]
VLRYGPTNKYGPHLDGLERVASVLIYLVAPEEGGETAFPHSNGWLHPEMGEPTQGPFSECAKGHVAYKPKRGDALMFFDLKPDYQTPDDDSMHTGCPVVRGVKWNAVKWIHGKPFNGRSTPP